MAEFSEYLYTLKPSPIFTDMDINMEMMKQLPHLNHPNTLQNFSLSDFSVLDSLFAHHLQPPPEFQSTFSHSNHSVRSPCQEILSSSPIVHGGNPGRDVLSESEKRKELEVSASSFNSKNSSPAASTSSMKKRNSLGGCKKVKNKEKGLEKAEEVIHVRAKRGQATDGHSIAERVRREKINNKLRCLQELVPGCHKSMGMAVMLEEIINYVHSLQNQVEFLSMELAAASCSYDINFETESSKKSQGTEPGEAQEMQKWWRQGNRELNCFHSKWSI